MLMRLMSKGEYLIVPKGTKFTGSGKLGLRVGQEIYSHTINEIPRMCIAMFKMCPVHTCAFTY